MVSSQKIENRSSTPKAKIHNSVGTLNQVVFPLLFSILARCAAGRIWIDSTPGKHRLFIVRYAGLSTKQGDFPELIEDGRRW